MSVAAVPTRVVPEDFQANSTTASRTLKHGKVRGGTHLQALCPEFDFMNEFSGNDGSAGKERRKMCHKGTGREQVLTCLLWLFIQMIKQEAALNTGSAQNGSHLRSRTCQQVFDESYLYCPLKRASGADQYQEQKMAFYFYCEDLKINLANSPRGSSV